MDGLEQSSPGMGILVDIQTELDYWKETIPRSEFALISLEFEHFVPSIKFGYDCYLLYHGQPLVEMLPRLREKYFKQIAVRDQLEWRWADQIIRHSWGRMQA